MTFRLQRRWQEMILPVDIKCIVTSMLRNLKNRFPSASNKLSLGLGAQIGRKAMEHGWVFHLLYYHMLFRCILKTAEYQGFLFISKDMDWNPIQSQTLRELGERMEKCIFEGGRSLIFELEVSHLVVKISEFQSLHIDYSTALLPSIWLIIFSL